MFKMADIYNMLKPKDNENSITALPVVFGGTSYAVDFVKGVCVVSLINSEACTSQTKHFSKKVDDDDKITLKNVSILQWNFQIDIYKKNDDDVSEIQAYEEAIKIREWLKTLQVSEYLKGLNAEIFANYGIINFVSELVDNKLINRAFFEFSIVGEYEISERDEWFDKINIDKIDTLEISKKG